MEHTGVPVPKAYLLCEDAAVIGTPFYVMEYVKGRIFVDPTFPGQSEAFRRAAITELVRILATLHQIIPSAVGLDDFGKHGGFINRQITTLVRAESLQAAAAGPISGMSTAFCLM